MEPLTIEYSVQKDDNRVVFPFIDRTGDMLVIIPRDKFEVLSDSGSSIILREISQKPPF